MTTLRPLAHADVGEHNAGEDEQTIRWLTGARGTVENTTNHFDRLASNARQGTGKQGFGVWVDDRLAGYFDADPDHADGLQPDDVNICRAKVVAAAGEAFKAEGLGVSLDEIARRAGMGAGTVHRHFPTKAELVDTVLPRTRGSATGRCRGHRRRRICSDR